MFVMKKIAVLLAGLVFCAVACNADGNKTAVAVTDLPAAGQELLARDFAGQNVSYVLREKEAFKVEYEVRLENGTEIELDADGQWKKIDCKASAVPQGLVPVEILTQVGKSFPAAFVVEIDKDGRGYDVELSNGLELNFDRRFNMSVDD